MNVSMARPTATLCALLTTAAACFGCDAAETADAVFGNDAADRAYSAVPVPFHGRFEGDLVLIPPFAPGSSPTCNANFSGDPEAPGPAVTLTDVSHGWFTHTGRIRLEAVTCLDPSSPLSTGSGVIFAANGDQLGIAFVNTTVPDPIDPTLLTAAGTQRITGGSGRFQDASGEQECQLRIRLTSETTASIEAQCEGWIRFGARGR